MKKEYLEIIRHFGAENQLKKLNEENFEFIEAVREYISNNRNGYATLEDKNHVIEEMADVMVILKQFKELFNIDSEQIESMIKSKVERTQERIKVGFYK